MKSPEEYFLERDFLDEGQEELTSAEKAFLKRYMGLGEEEEKGEPPSESAGVVQAAPEERPPGTVPEKGEAGVTEQAPGAGDVEFEAAAEPGPEKESPPTEEPEAEEPDLEDVLKAEAEVQLVAFTVKGQEYTVPIAAVQEVIRFMEPTKLPAAPPFLAGIVNLRGRVTPLVRLYRLLGVPGEDEENRFIVVCRRKGLQFGLMIEKMKTMYHMPQDRIDWSVEAHLGITVDYVSGLLKGEEGLIGILSVDNIVGKVLTG
jgi:purine-binding chemotaxis protein CheW